MSLDMVETNVLQLPKAETPMVESTVKTNLQAQQHYIPPVSGWFPLEAWSLGNGLNKPQKIGPGQYAVVTRQGVLVMNLGSQMARWDGTQISLGFAPRIIAGQPHVHSIDAYKTLEPLLHRSPPISKPGRLVVIDPGHGGADGGTHGTNQQLEKNYALDWALRLAPLLQSNGWRVQLTRTTDLDLSVTNRVAFADRVGADLFISLHFNGLNAQANHSGIQTFCLTPAGMPSAVTRGYEDNPRAEFPNNSFDLENLQYAFRIHRELLAATRAVDGGVRHARFMGVLRGQRRPAVLIEGGFLSTPAEASRIATPSYRQKLAEAVARALAP
jgi:N-acetylmuramoyl-L-alanine amidase